MNSCTTMIITLCFIFLCSLTVVNSATVTINALGATTTSPTTKTYVGPLKLVDDPALGFTLDFNATFGSGDTLTGLKLQVGAKSNDNPGCTEFKTITTDIWFSLILPKDFTDLLATNEVKLALGSGGLDILPDLSLLTSKVTLPQQEFDVSTLTPPYADYELPLSEKMTTDKKTVMNFLGVELTLILALSELKVYKKGMEVPVYLKVEILKKSIMKTQTATDCGNKNEYFCGAESCGGATTTGYTQCTACGVLCTGVGTILDAISGTSDTAAVVDKKYDVLKELKTFATAQSVTLPDNIQDCATDATVTCMRIGEADVCPAPSSDLGGAATNSFYLMSYLAVFAIFAMFYEF